MDSNDIIQELVLLTNATLVILVMSVNCHQREDVPRCGMYSEERHKIVFAGAVVDFAFTGLDVLSKFGI